MCLWALPLWDLRSTMVAWPLVDRAEAMVHQEWTPTERRETTVVAPTGAVASQSSKAHAIIARKLGTRLLIAKRRRKTTTTTTIATIIKKKNNQNYKKKGDPGAVGLDCEEEKGDPCAIGLGLDSDGDGVYDVLVVSDARACANGFEVRGITAFVDSASSRVYMGEELAEKLGATYREINQRSAT